jgi:predicted permease
MPLEAADLLLPAQLRPLDPNDRIMQSIVALGRLRSDVTPEQAEIMLAPQLPEMGAGAPPGFRNAWRVRPLHDRWVGDAARVAWLLAGAVACVLLIACVNVANLMLARAAERHREFVVRAAIGAHPARLTRLALAESLLLALTAGGLGLVMSFALLQTFVAMAPPGIPGLSEASMDLRVLGVALMLVVLTGVTIGLWPAIAVFRAGSVQGLRATGASSLRTSPRVRFGLVSTQVALTLALTGGSALLLRSLWNVINVPLGFDAGRVVTLTTTLGRARHPTVEHSTAFFEELLARVRAMPGTLSVALSDAAPPPQSAPGRALIGVEGRPIDPGVPLPGVGLRQVTTQYLETFRIPLVTGRTFQETDRKGEPVVVLNESAARALFAGDRALGQRIRAASNGPWHTVIGVAADVRNGRSLTDGPVPEIYMLARPTWGPIGRLSLRTTANAADVAAFLRRIVADLDPRQLATTQTIDDLLTTLTAQPRFITSLLTAFAGLALLLAAAGLYSVASYLVTQRHRDIGVRIAIGASPRDVARQFVGEAGRWIVGGAVVGAAIGWMGTRALQSQLYQVETLDPWSWTGALLTLAAVLVIAVFRPAYRAAHVDPVAALRAD